MRRLSSSSKKDEKTGQPTGRANRKRFVNLTRQAKRKQKKRIEKDSGDEKG
jgi:hypothetical protein